MVSDDANALATQQSIKKYVDDQNANQQTTVAADSGTITVQLGTTTLGIIGTSNEIVTDTTTNNVRIGLTDDVTIPSDLTVTDNLSVSGNAILGTTAPGSNPFITANARFNSSLIPFTDDQHDLGNGTRQWRNLFIDGTAEIDSLVADTADINGGTIDNVTIGGDTAGAATFTLVDVDNIRINGSTILTTPTNQNLTLNPNGTGDVVISGDLDVNGDLDVSGNCQLGNGTGDTVTIPSILDVNGRADIDFIRIDGNTISATNSNGSVNLVPQGSGAVVVGTNSDTSDLLCKGDVVAFHTSDKTLKENITRIPDALDKVSTLSGNTFTWIEGSKYEGEDDTGVIAQEVEALGLPGLTTTRHDGTKAVRYERLIPVLIEAIKELKAEIDILKK